MKKISAFIATAALAFSANAATVSFEYGLPIVESTTDINETGFLGLFDSSMGTLTGAKLDIFGSATTTMTLRNNGSTPQVGKATSFVNMSWSSSLGGLDALLVDELSMSFDTGAPLMYSAEQSRTFGPLSDAGSFSYDLSSLLASLQASGGGFFGLTCESESGISLIGAGGNLASTQSTGAGCGARVVYFFEDKGLLLPEPGSFALMGLAIAAVGVATRRRVVSH